MPAMTALKDIRIYHELTIGTFHTNHCEDFLFHGNVGEHIILAVMDGCTMGTDSYFASTLIGKLLRKISKSLDYKEFVTKDTWSSGDLLREIMKRLFEQLKIVRGNVDLKREELLSTLLISVVNTKKRSAEVLVIGDGLVVCDGELTEFEQDNQPDYLGYHLEEDFDEWFDAQEQRLSLLDIADLSLATDGVFSFRTFDDGDYSHIESEAIIQRMLIDIIPRDTKKWFRPILSLIEKKFGLKASDDLGVVRLVLDK